ncbi:hypothetical protein FRB97_004367 [Tulasnella sp. 331]|nr:hypothetical protein FRB97_004367 [Tulasnella sp. 331]
MLENPSFSDSAGRTVTLIQFIDSHFPLTYDISSPLLPTIPFVFGMLRPASSLEFSLDGKYVLSEDKKVQTVWDVAGEGDELPMGPPARSAVGDTVNVLTIDESGWLLDLGGKRMFWVPVVLRPQSLEFDREGIRSGRILVNGNILTMEIPTVPIIDISAYVSKDL